MDVCVKNGIEMMGLSVKDSIRMATLTPAEIAGVSSRKGSISKNKDADIIIVDEKCNVLTTIAKGKIIYNVPMC
jgi:N-acetylglucosamine-6-phosphate deacetylase